MIQLSVCVIGRNEAANLPRIVDSLKKLADLPLQCQTLYVDSASTDGSVEIAKPFFCRTLLLAASPNLCASAGRHAGTLAATGEWILYLDADMTLQEEFFEFLKNVCSRPAADTGWVGRCDYLFDDGGVALNVGPKRLDNQEAPNFGGAVLLPRSLVLAVGNWAPGVFSNEELELYTRIKARGYRVMFRDVGMIHHYTPRQSKMRSLASLFLPSAGLGKKFYGFGQIIHHRLRQKSLWSYIQHNPLPFFWFACIASALTSLLAGEALVAGLILLAGTGVVAAKRGSKGIVFVSGLVIQGCWGYFRYDAAYSPLIERSYCRESA